MRRISEYVKHESYIGAVADVHGNLKDEWTDPIDLGIYAFNPGVTEELPLPGHDRVVTSPTLYVPSGTVMDHRDRVTVRGKAFEVDGEVRDFRNPYGESMNGCSVNLKAVTG